jgi:hypothetical protein
MKQSKLCGYISYCTTWRWSQYRPKHLVSINTRHTITKLCRWTEFTSIVFTYCATGRLKIKWISIVKPLSIIPACTVFMQVSSTFSVVPVHRSYCNKFAGFYSQWKFITLKTQYTTVDHSSQLFYKSNTCMTDSRITAEYLYCLLASALVLPH